MPSPFDLPDPFAQAYGQLGLSAPNQHVQRPESQVTKEEESNLLEKIGQAGLGGLGFIGGILGKPGRVVRGLLGGTPREALNVIPFSDALGITDPTQAVSGHELLKRAGLAQEHDPSLFSGEGVAGFATELATDPLSYLSFGSHALTSAGKLAQKAGTLPKTVAERAAQGLGGHIGVGLPFGGNLATADLSGVGSAIGRGIEALPGGSAVTGAARGLAGAAGNLYTKTIPPLFEGAVMGRKTATGQNIARAITEGTPEAIAAANSEAMPLAQLAKTSGLTDDLSASRLRNIGETGVGGDASTNAILDPIRASNARQIQEKLEMGLPAQELAKQTIRQGTGEGNELGYLTRYSEQNAPKSAAEYLKSKSPSLSTEKARKDWTDGLTTESLNKMQSETIPATTTSQNPLQQVQKHIEDNYLNVPRTRKEVEAAQAVVDADMVAHQGMVTNKTAADALTAKQAEQAALEEQARELAKMKVAGALPVFSNHPVADFAKKTAETKINLLKAEEIYKGTAGAATTIASDGTVPIMDGLKQLWNTTETAGQAGAAPMGAQVQMAKALGVPVSELSKYHISQEIMTDIAGLTKMHSINGLESFTRLWDSVTNLTKAGQTMFPSVVARNAAQDFFNKMVYGAKYSDYHALNPMGYIQPVLDWMKISNGGTVEGISQRFPHFSGLDDAGVSQKIRELYTQWDVGRQGVKRTAVSELGADIGAKAEKGLESLLPIEKQQNPLQAYVGGIKEGSFKDVTGVSGFMGKTEDTFALVRAMRSANNANDNIQRGSTFMSKLSQGFEPAEAFKETMKAHYDFSNMSQFERSFMRRVIPFYSWARQNIPAVVGEIAENPGGLLSTSVKATQAAKGEHPGFVRPDVGEGVAIPLGAEENGQQRYLSHFGLGFEDLGNLLGPGGGAGMLNPLIKAPLEAATGRQLSTGRDLRDVHSRLADLTGIQAPGLENAVMNSPLSRVLSTSGTLADPRKNLGADAVNLLTGARVQDVDQEAARRSAVRDYAMANLHGPGVNQFSSISIKPDDLKNLSPLQQTLYRVYQDQRSRRPVNPLTGQ